jgi:hypothetical protein
MVEAKGLPGLSTIRTPYSSLAYNSSGNFLLTYRYTFIPSGHQKRFYSLSLAFTDMLTNGAK